VLWRVIKEITSKGKKKKKSNNSKPTQPASKAHACLCECAEESDKPLSALEKDRQADIGLKQSPHSTEAVLQQRLCYNRKSY
jgi:hypothetical protein